MSFHLGFVTKYISSNKILLCKKQVTVAIVFVLQQIVWLVIFKIEKFWYSIEIYNHFPDILLILFKIGALVLTSAAV